MKMQSVSAHEAQRMIANGAILVDIRDPDEHARERIHGAMNFPLARIGELSPGNQPVVFQCRAGMRTAANDAVLAENLRGAPGHILAGGIDAWRSAGFPTIKDRKQPLEIMRQVQLIAGGLVLLGLVLGLLASPVFAILSAFVGAGLMLAGATGWCGMALLLRRMPWNRRGFAG
ncbi:MAG: rhodanese family protein [Novosphingobium sp.]